MVSAAGGIVIAILVLVLVAVLGWVVFTQLRARRLGVPAAPVALVLHPLPEIRHSAILRAPTTGTEWYHRLV
ncbi:hypothetical protein CH063_07232 [Colletotrichum higginsianum]|uniref:Uncharacterized protein n=1 Tax=Colletotrichum higginsianum (strain IMI 349063) TaxID=759273 RepID=H1V5E4_COLHI|nr:hypothetical protein CH063_07232 [Colletotrichum higginsianum]